MPPRYLLACETSQAVKFRFWLESVALLLVDGNFVFSKDGLGVQGATLDGIWIKTDLNNFDSYKYDIENHECFPLGISFRLLYQCFRSAKDNDIVGLFVTANDLYGDNPKNICRMQWKITSENRITKGEVHLREVDNTIAELVPVQYDCVFDVPSQMLKDTIQQHTYHGECVQFFSHVDPVSSDVVLIVHTKGDLSEITSTLSGTVCPTDENMESLVQSCDKRDLFRLRTLLKILKAINLCPFVTVKLRPNYPLILEMKVGELGTMKFALAVQDEEGEKTLQDFEAGLLHVPKGESKKKKDTTTVSSSTSTSSSSSTSSTTAATPRKRQKRKLAVIAHPRSQRKNKISKSNDNAESDAS